MSRHGTLNNLHSKSEQQAINWNLIIAYTRKDMVIIMLNRKLNINNEWGGRRQYSCSLSAKKSMRRRVFMEPIYLEFREKLVGNEDESARAVSLADGPPIALLLTALVQLAAWYLCISPNYHRHTAPSIKPLLEVVKAKLHSKNMFTRVCLTKGIYHIIHIVE